METIMTEAHKTSRRIRPFCRSINSAFCKTYLKLVLNDF